MTGNICFPCRREFHEECVQGDPCCCPEEQAGFSTEKTLVPLGEREVGESAGRKEAARLYPVNETLACEWKGLANVGGGKFPVVGCIDGLQKARHHGPVKRTTVNHRYNIHLICTSCHNWWHAKNDKHYKEEEYALLPHKPRPAEPLELVRGNASVAMPEPVVTEPDDD